MLKFMYKFLLVPILLIASFTASFSQGYNIQIKIIGLKDTSVYLGYYLGDKKYIVDTAHLDKKGISAFKGVKTLDEGLYLVILPNKTFFDIIISKDQDFALVTDTTYLLMNLKIKDSKDNQTFSDYQKHMIFNQKKSADIRKRLAIQKNNTDSVKILNEKLLNIKKEVDEYNDIIIKKDPKSMVSKFIKATVEIAVPDPPKDAKGNITDSLFQYRYFKKHYFDNIDFSDERLMRTPFLQVKVDNFFKKTVMQIPDSIIYEAERLIEMSKANKQMFRYFTAYLLNKYETSKYIGMEKVLVSIADKYYFSGQATWADTTFIKKLKESIEKIRPNMMGNKAPDLKRLETNIGEWATLSEIKAKLLIVAFWEPHCSHCQKVIPKLHDIYKKYKKNKIEVLAFYTQTDTSAWNKFIEENDLTDWINVYDRYGLSNFRNLYDIFTTPCIYILDENKNIIARKIDIEAIEKFIGHFIIDENADPKK